ncbi:MAG: UDP-N-acetylenolpyruvoylglucosamine reductase [Crocinitomicaceae bacterium]|nr:UDP-N-acetylenolpyruvoylglucosamine reductase [Crocinitomicaceae bacterium]|tara:strand:+ start:419 stop:1438 length:1020 start_codon:yes stop_codon:yes gene_type:complete
MQVYDNYDLSELNSFGIAASCKHYCSVSSEEGLKEILNHPSYKNLSILPLGGGSNILLTKDFNGLVIKMDFGGIEKFMEDGDFYYVKVGAGINWHQFVLHCIDQNWSGVENLSLIPGNVGAAPMQNIGAYGVEVKDVIESVHFYDKEKQSNRVLKAPECEFGYRTSIFKTSLKGKVFITHVIFRLPKKIELKISYGAISQELADNNIVQPTIRDVSNAVIAIRSSKLPDPTKIGNAGSFFKNPVVSSQVARDLLKTYPDAPHYEVGNDQVKIPAGWLIEKAGWKGKTFDESFGIHKNQALVLVNYQNATGLQIYDLSQNILEDIERRFGILLEREVNII